MITNKLIVNVIPSRLLGMITLMGTLLVLGGCTHIYNLTGSAIVKYGKDQMIPYFLSTEDPYVACAMGESLSPVLLSFGEVTDQMTTVIALASGMCADLQSRESELRYLRALRKNDPIEAEDARIQQKRYTALAAKRMVEGYNALVRVYGEPGGKCPKLKGFDNQLFWMIGLMDGMQAVLADVSSDSKSNIPMGIIPKVLEGVKCLDSEEWWGLPEGISSLVLILLPTELPPGVTDPYKDLAHSIQVGKNKGVRIGQMLEAALYENQGKTEELKAVIRDHVQTKEKVPGDPALRFLDEMATMQIRLISDRLWTEATGKRTPYGKLGTFWDDPKTSSALDIDDLI
ncbi:MAG: hypothetical protein KUG82_09340 [Pseudomonadales bacterium]|nr:hypothetical protein [Pseudomonadales bacterium]